MAGTDVRLDAGPDGGWVQVEAHAVDVRASDLMLLAEDRLTPGHSLYRRALVHDQADGLTVNFNGDYPGGLRLLEVAEVVPQTPPRDDRVVQARLRATPALVIRGDVQFESHPALPLPGAAVQTYSLLEELATLRRQLTELAARVSALEAR